MKWNLDKIWNYKLRAVNSSSLREKAIKGTAVFFVILIVFTLLSRAADSVTVAKVGIGYAEKKVIEHTVSASGKVEQNQEQSISTSANIKVKKINVNEGQTVQAGDTLFELDMENIQEQILVLEHEIEKMELALADLESSQSVDQASKNTTKLRAEQDYNNAVQDGNTAIAQAYEEMMAAYNALIDYRNSTSDDNGEGDQVAAVLVNTVTQSEQAFASATESLAQLNQEINTNIEEKQTEAQLASSSPLTKAQLNAIENDIRNEYSALLKDANAAVSSAEAAKTEAVSALSKYQSAKAAESAQSASDAEQTLLDTYNTKVRAYDTAVEAKSDSLLDRSRAIEDANKETASNSNAKQSELDKELKLIELNKLNQLAAAGGLITAPVDGVITKIDVTVGSSTTGSASMLMADTTSGTKFVTQLTQEQQKYISRNDVVTLVTADKKTTVENLTVDMISANNENSALMDITVLIPDGSIDIGTNATLEVTKKSDPYNLCVPIEAIRSDGNTNYVLVVKEVKTVLGTELQAERMDVTILEQNEKYAALAEGAVTTENQIITSSSRQIEAGDRIRLEEE